MNDTKLNIENLIVGWKILGHLNLIDTVFNHISISNGSIMLMNKKGYLAEQIRKNRISTFPIKKYLPHEAQKLCVNPDGLVLHSAIHQFRKKSGVVIHTHSPYAIAVGNYPDGLLPISQTAMEFANELEIFEFSGLVRKNSSLSPKLKNIVQRGGVALLRQHGVLIVTDSIYEAVYLAYYIEEACKIQVISLLQGKAINIPQKSLINSTSLLMKEERLINAKELFTAFRKKFIHNA